MKEWLSTMPVFGEKSPAVARTAGSARRTSAPDTRLSASTPLARPRDKIDSRAGSSSADVATMYFPIAACST